MLTNFNSNSDWFYLILAGLIVDYVAVFFAKYPGPSPYFKVDALNEWYTKEKLKMLLIIGPVGCGKTSLVELYCKENSIQLYSVKASETIKTKKYRILW